MASTDSSCATVNGSSAGASSSRSTALIWAPRSRSTAPAPRGGELAWGSPALRSCDRLLRGFAFRRGQRHLVAQVQRQRLGGIDGSTLLPPLLRKAGQRSATPASLRHALGRR